MATRRHTWTTAPALLLVLSLSMARPSRSAGVAPLPTADTLDRDAVYLAAETLRPDTLGSLHRQSAAVLSAGHYIVQLDGPLTLQRRDVLKAAGIELGDYLPFHAYVVALPEGYDATRLAPLPFVRWVGSFEPQWKLHPAIGSRTYQTAPRRELAARDEVALSVTLFAGADAAEARSTISSIAGAQVHWIDGIGAHDVLRITIPRTAVSALAAIDAIQFVEETEEVVLHNATNRWIVQSNVVNKTPLHDHGLTGAGQIVGILDTGVYLAHCAFFDPDPVGPLHRKAEAINTWPGYVPGSENPGPHGTHVACTILGDAGVIDNTRGLAYDARFVLNTTPPHDGPGIMGRLEHHSSQGARLHSNSWGDLSIDYGSLTRGLDVFCHDYEDELVVFACGNDAIGTNPQNAKNCLSVSGTMDAPNQDQYCIGGAGPTVDGRRKPEICAPACNTLSASVTNCLTQPLTGTSMACPVIAASGLLVRQYYMDGYYPDGAPEANDGFLPSAALIKATLLNSTVDLTGEPGYPANREGWGRLRADDALYFPGDRRRLAVLADIRNAEGMSTGEVIEYPMIVAGNVEPLKVTLAFNDPPGGVGIGNAPAWVNDLDLEVVAPGGTLYLGNVFVNGQSASGGSKDDRNNVEQVHIPSPAVGLWTIRIRAAAVNVGAQGHSLIATGVVWSDPNAIAIDLPDGVPDVISPVAGTPFLVDIISGVEAVAAGSPMLHYRFADGPFETTPLDLVSGTRYTAMLPIAPCSGSPEFYISAAGSEGTIVTSPVGAPVTTYAAVVGAATTPFADNFETDRGWTVVNENLVNGAWVRVIPSGTGQLGDPTSDYDGSGHCYVTGAANFQDVNGGPTRLISPAIALSGSFDPMLSYARWFRDTGVGDTLVVELSNNDGSSWSLVEAAQEAEFWTPVTVRIADYVVPTANVRIRFSTQDTPNNSFTEAAIDAVRIDDFGCDAGCTRGDVNGDGNADGRDIDRLIALLTGEPPTPGELCAADLHVPADSTVSLADLDEVVSCLLGDCDE